VSRDTLTALGIIALATLAALATVGGAEFAGGLRRLAPWLRRALAAFRPRQGIHCAPRRSPAEIFRRILRGLRRKQAAPEVPPPSGAVPDGEPVMGDRMIAEVRAERGRAVSFANAMHEKSVPYVEDQQPRNGAYLGTLPHYPDAVVRRGKAPWYTTPFASPPVPTAVYGEKPQLTVAAQLAKQLAKQEAS
jgi:hypothetical protein